MGTSTGSRWTRIDKRRVTRVVGAVALSGLAASLLAACGGGSSGGGGTDSGNSRGPITYVQGKDNNGILKPLAEMWNKDHPDEQVTIREQSDQADAQHDDLVQNFQAKNADYDVVSVDVVWTAEFAAQGWLVPLEGDYKVDTTGFLKPTVDAATFNKKLYAVPGTSDGGLLYYRSDIVKTPPTTWAEMIADCANKGAVRDCYAGQFAQYEGLTVNASEAINGAGGHILDDSGKPDVNTDAAKKGLSFLTDGFKQGYIPANGLTFQETQSLDDFQQGNLLFLRNWPYAYSLLSATDGSSKVNGKFAIAPLPGLDGLGASTLGGHSIAISEFSDHKQTARDFLEFYTSETTQKFLLEESSLAPVRESLYDDASLQSKFGYLPTLKTAIENAVPRPVTPFYPAVTQAIQQNIFAALQGDKSVDQALSDLQAALETATSGN
jgi:multiple sugar transport system substrate-binding protein